MTQTQLKAGISKTDAFKKDEWRDKLKSLLKTYGVEIWDFDFPYDLCGKGLHELYCMLEMIGQGITNKVTEEVTERVVRLMSFNNTIEAQIDEVEQAGRDNQEEIYNQWLEEIKARRPPYLVQILIPFKGPTSFGTYSRWEEIMSLEEAITYADAVGGSIWQDVEGMGLVRVRREIKGNVG